MTDTRIKHTPGPWVADGIYSEASQSGIFDILTKDGELNGALIAKVEGQRSDALLIAAAPELLEWLKWALDQLLGCELAYGAKCNDEAAYAAIAKAEGRAQ